MLSRRRRACVALALATLTASPSFDARAQGDGDGVRRPERVTAGVSDQLLGQLSPDGRTLYFVSNRNTISEIFSQDLLGGRAKELFDESADVTWPRVSPDGKPASYVTKNGGKTWQRQDKGLPRAQGWFTVKRQAMCGDARDPVGLYFGTTGGEVWASRNEGAQWMCIARHLPEIYAVEVAG